MSETDQAAITAFRTAENALWASRGLTPSEEMLRLPTLDVDVRAQITGSGPTIVFVHGASNGGASWAALARLLPDFRCVMIDRPGCGLSGTLPRPPSDVAEMHQVGDTLVADVIAALGLDDALVVGTSYGAYFSLRGAAAHPDRIPRLVLLGWCFGAPMERVPMSMRIGAIPGMAALSAKVPPTRSVVKMLLRQIGLKGALASGEFDDISIDWFLALLRNTDTMANEIATTPQAILPIRGMNPDVLLTDELLSQVEIPVQFLWGDDDPNGGAATARAFAARLPDAALEIRSGVGHAPWIDESAHTADVVRAFFS